MSKVPVLETDRLLLRAFNADQDMDAYAAIMGEYEVGKWLPKGDGYTREQTERYLTFVENHWESRGYGVWAVVSKQTGELLGHCGLNFIEAIEEVEVLYAFGTSGRQRGYGTEAASAVLDYAFGVLGMDVIMAVSKPDNLPSRRVMEKNGMTYVKTVDLFNQTGLVYYAMTKDQHAKLSIS